MGAPWARRSGSRHVTAGRLQAPHLHPGRGARTSSPRHAETPRRSGRACPRPRCPGGSCRSCFGAQRHLGDGVGFAVGSSSPARAGGHGHGLGNEPRTTCRELRVPGERPQPGMLGVGIGAGRRGALRTAGIRGATQGTTALGSSPTGRGPEGKSYGWQSARGPPPPMDAGVGARPAPHPRPRPPHRWRWHRPPWPGAACSAGPARPCPSWCSWRSWLCGTRQTRSGVAVR